MAKTIRSLVPLTVAVLCIVLMAAYSTSPRAKGQSKQNDKAETQKSDQCILVEAFVVEVQLEALYKLGVSPISQKPDAVTVENILDCLDGKDMAEVSTGLKISVLPEKAGEAKTTEKVYVERQASVPASRRTDSRGPAASKSFQSHEISRQLSTWALIRPNGMILMDFTFQQSTYRQAPTDDEKSPNTIGRQWSGTACLEPGEPVIAGTTQDGETAVFLVLCAYVKGR
jgi:hypothetical protein